MQESVRVCDGGGGCDVTLSVFLKSGLIASFLNKKVWITILPRTLNNGSSQPLCISTVDR